MSVYLDMWAKIHELDEEAREQWIEKLRPARGVGVDFFGVNCTDVDLIEALKNAH